MQVKGVKLGIPIAGLLLTLWPPLAGIEIKNASVRFYDEREFTRLPEFFHGDEVSTSRLIIRTYPEERVGLYILLWLDENIETLPAGSKAELLIFTSESREMETYTFALGGTPQDTRRIWLGLTGEDWSGENEYPLAWKVTISDPNGQTLAEFKSFLWEMR